MKPAIKKLDCEQEYYFKEGCHIIEVSNSDSDEAVSIARVRVEVGQQTRWHCLTATTERYVVLQGIGQVEVGDLAPATIESGDVVIIPADTRQRIRNTGTEDLSFLAICSPRFKLGNYRSE